MRLRGPSARCGAPLLFGVAIVLVLSSSCMVSGTAPPLHGLVRGFWCSWCQTPSAGAALEDRLAVKPGRPYALEPTEVIFRTGLPAAHPRVQAVSPRGHVLRVRMSRTHAATLRKGVLRFPIPGRWQLRATNDGAHPRIWVQVRPARPTPPPPGYGPVGRRGCAPPSPANTGKGVHDVFGTARAGEQLWALPFVPEGGSWARPDAAVFDGLVGKEIKIVFAQTTYPNAFAALAPDGTQVQPVWGPTFHSGSNWGRPGYEWGAGFVFSQPGCWRITTRSADVWLLVLS